MTAVSVGDALPLGGPRRNVLRPLQRVAVRLGASVVLLVIISVGIFSLLQLAPGSTIRTLLGAQQATSATIAALEAKYHLNGSFLQQYWYWAGNALHGDFGTSVSTLQPVSTVVGQRLEPSVILVLYSLVVTLVIGMTLGIVAARNRGRVLDRVCVGVTLIGTSAPAFAVAVLLLFVFSIEIHLFPAFGTGGSIGSEIGHLTLPALALGFSASGIVSKAVRLAFIDVLEQDYVAFARARGVGELRILLAYGMRNAAVQAVTSIGLVVAFLITNLILVEQAFSIPGVGSLLVQAVEQKDTPVVQGITLLMAVAILATNMLVDVAYVAIDPRIRQGGKP